MAHGWGATRAPADHNEEGRSLLALEKACDVAAAPRSKAQPAIRRPALLGFLVVFVAVAAVVALAAAAGAHPRRDGAGVAAAVASAAVATAVAAGAPEPEGAAWRERGAGEIDVATLIGAYSVGAEGVCDDSKCLEDGHPDDDCCAPLGLGGCADGRAFITGEECAAGLRVCCRPPRFAEDGACTFPEEGKCTENGRGDDDCCAAPGEGGCIDGFAYTQGEACPHRPDAVTSCCSKQRFVSIFEEPYDCTVESGVWDDDKRSWCCENKRVGCKSECAADGENCLVSECCRTPGSQCYAKDENVGFCRSTCLESSWSCREVGVRAEDDSTATGSWPGSDCGWTRRCNMPGMTCYAQNPYFASCQRECHGGHLSNGQTWSCQRLGGFEQPEALIGAEPGRPLAGTTLFCVMVVSMANVVTTGEAALYDNQKAKGIGPFACDGSAVYWAPEAPRGEWVAVANVDIFVDVWKKVEAAGVYRNYDWVVKADADTVLFPDRLKRRLEMLRPPAEAALYLQNADSELRFQGSLEVFSREALDVYVRHQELCVKHIGNGGGEDLFLRTCMDAIGVGFMRDTSLLSDRGNHGEASTGVDTEFCNFTDRVAYHPLKTVDSWNACYEGAKAADPMARAIIEK